MIEYGPVEVIKGRFKGKVGYYDNDEGDKAVVYFGAFFDGYELIPIKHIQATDKDGPRLHPEADH